MPFQSNLFIFSVANPVTNWFPRYILTASSPWNESKRLPEASRERRQDLQETLWSPNHTRCNPEIWPVRCCPSHTGHCCWIPARKMCLRTLRTIQTSVLAETQIACKSAVNVQRHQSSSSRETRAKQNWENCSEKTPQTPQTPSQTFLSERLQTCRWFTTLSILLNSSHKLWHGYHQWATREFSLHEK